MKALQASAVLSACLVLGALCSAQDIKATKVSDGQQNPAGTQKPMMPPSRTYPLPADVKTLDGIMLAVYDVISGPAGERDWNRLRSLFIPDARIIPTEPKQDGTFEYHAMDIDALIELAKARFKNQGFYEREISHKVESFGCVAHVFSSYESRETPEGKPFERGVNSIQLFNDGSRWWVVTIYWDRERPGNPIPARYLP